jgi:hypothetical protein
MGMDSNSTQPEEKSGIKEKTDENHQKIKNLADNVLHKRCST